MENNTKTTDSVTIRDIDIPFNKMMLLALKMCFAFMPAIILVSMIYSSVMAAVFGAFR